MRQSERNLLALALVLLLGGADCALAKKHKEEEPDYSHETSSSAAISPALNKYVTTPATASASSAAPSKDKDEPAEGEDKDATASDKDGADKSDSSVKVNASSTSSKSGDDADASSHKLHGSAEVNMSAGDNQQRAWRAAQIYKQGVAALGYNNFRYAAEYFKQSGDLFESTFGYEKALAESRYAEAQARRLIGQTQRSVKCYQAAIDLFAEYDPLSGYLRPAMDNLKKLAPNLSGQLQKNEFKLKALTLNNRVVSIDRHVILKGKVTDSGQARLIAEKALLDLGSDYVKNTIHKAFVRMTCLETADIGSNYTNADNRWLPLIADNKTVAITVSQDGINPIITLKLNERFVNTSVDLPGLAGSKRTVLLLTDGRSVIAIDPGTEDIWKLLPSFDSKGAHTSSWQHLVHRKGLHFTDNEKN